METLRTVVYEILKTFAWRLPISLMIGFAAIALMGPAITGVEVDLDFSDWLSE